jgi:hypothetical protein
VFIRFARRQLETLDYDPFHPMLVHLQRGTSVDEGLWSSFLYMAFYNLGSAYCAWTTTRPMQALPAIADRWSIGTQRRNLRASSVCKHVESLASQARPHGSLYSFFTHDFTGNEKADWLSLLNRLEGVWGNGRWGAYTTAELLQKVNQLPVQPATLGLEGATGPRKGLVVLTGLSAETSTEVMQVYGDALLAKLRSLFPNPRIPWARHGIDFAMTESILCDFYGLTKGRYYIGRDIDREAGRILSQSGRTDVDMGPLWAARATVFPPHLLAERRRTVLDIDYERARVYKETGLLADYRDDFPLLP